MRSVLLITAHPDDECMFFTPSIRKFVEEGFRVDLLCLSDGNFDGMGAVRMVELRKSAKVLEINSVTIIKDEELQDGPTNYWKSGNILKHVKKACEDQKYEMIVTFDERGISGHVNHCAISRAFDKERFEHWQLVSLPVWIKYSGPFGILIIFILNTLRFHILDQNPNEFTNSNLSINYNYINYTNSYKFGYKAMLEHKSQMVWFRRLYLWVSVYMNVNIIKRRIYSKINKNK